MNPEEYERDQFYRHNKWGVRVIKRGSDCDVGHIVKCKGFPDELTLARGLWPNDAMIVVNEHNDALAKALFKQTESTQASGNTARTDEPIWDSRNSDEPCTECGRLSGHEEWCSIGRNWARPTGSS